MVAILEHHDHRKAGRALMIVSVSYILLQNCSTPFDTSGVLGLKVHLTRDDLLRAFDVLIWVYLVLFAVRIGPHIGLETFRSFVAERDELVKTLESQLKVWGTQKAKDISEKKERKIRQLVAERDRDTLGAELERELIQINDEQADEQRKLTDLKKKLEKAAKGKHRWLAYMDFGLFYASEVIPPVVFFILTFVNVQGMVCPSASTEALGFLGAP